MSVCKECGKVGGYHNHYCPVSMRQARYAALDAIDGLGSDEIPYIKVTKES